MRHLSIGIDLGTTNSAVAWIDARGTPTIIPNAEGSSITPSVICFKNGEVIVGQPAKDLQAAGEPDVAAFFKRQMGVPHFVSFLNGKDYTAVDLSAILLQKLKADAEAALGARITDAVITVPAYFRNPQRADTIAAGQRAGLNVLQVINEPTAAAIAYGMQAEKGDQTLLVYDLGGGTFDVSLLRRSHAELRILTSDGDNELGGKDWDDRILQYMASCFKEEFGADPFEDLESVSELLVRAERAKKQLSTCATTTVSIVHAGNRGRYSLDRSTFDRITADLMERTVSLTSRILKDQKLKPASVDGVLLVGGSTRMPMVHDFIMRDFHKPPLMRVNVDEAVALGAAVVAHERGDKVDKPRLSLGGAVRTVDVTNHSLGMIALNEKRDKYLNSIILPKNTPVPCVLTRPYQHRTRRRGTNVLEIFMTQGESQAPGDASYLGMYVLHDVPLRDGGVTVIDVEYSYDVGGTVTVQGRARGDKAPLRMTVEPLPQDIPARFLAAPIVEAAPQHTTAYMAFDLSGSMAGPPMIAAQAAARSFLANTDLAHCSLGIIAFSDSVAVTLAACQDARKMERAIAELCCGETGFGNDAEPFSTFLTKLKGSDGPRFAITLTDGVWSDQDAAIKRAKACHAAGIESIAIGFGAADRGFLRAIASSDEAGFFTSLNGLVETFTTIAQVLTNSSGGSAPRPSSSKSLFSFISRKPGS